jgi:hypothetical protein
VRARDELDRLYASGPPLARERGSVDLLVVRRGAERHETPTGAALTCEQGLVGDRWVDGWGWQRDVERQLTLMMTGVAELVCDGQPLDLPGDNLLVSLDLSVEALPVGARLRVGEALIEITAKPHAGCKKFLARFGADALAWINDDAGKQRRLRGVNSRVIEPGTVRVGDGIVVISR